jgi:dTDP-4-amino-4,6-dideoxygalactose transaminase
VYADHPRVLHADIPETRRAAAEVVSIPVHHQLREADVDRIVEVIRKVLDG